MSDKGTDAHPTVMVGNSGKEKERDLDFRPEDTIRYLAGGKTEFSLTTLSLPSPVAERDHITTRYLPGRRTEFLLTTFSVP